MKRYLLALAMAGALIAPAHAQEKPDTSRVMRGIDGNQKPFVIRIYDHRPCLSPEVLTWLLRYRVPAEYVRQFKGAHLQWDSKPYEACWFEWHRRILVYDSEGDLFNQPAGLEPEAFKDEST